MHKPRRSSLFARTSNLTNAFLRLGEQGSCEQEISRIRAVRLATVWNNTPWMMAANLGNAVLTIIVFSDHPSSLLITIICALLIAIAFHTSVSWWRGREKAARTYASIRGTRNATIYAALLSGLWAMIDIVSFADATDSQKQVVIALTVGMTAGGGFALATIPAAAIAFCTMMGLGAAISLLLTPDMIGLYLFGLFIIYSAIIVRASLALCQSLTERVRAKMAALEQRDVINLLLNDFEENAADWLWGTDADLRIERASPRFCEQLQVPENFILGKPIFEALPFAKVGSKAIDGTEMREEFHRRLYLTQSFRDVDICVEQAGELAIWSLTAKAIFDASGTFLGYRGVGRDVTANREARLRIEHLARHDPLTDTGNRVLLSEDLARAIARHERFGDPFSVLLLDLDRFKQVNDTHGHGGGDELLREVARMLHSLCDETDTLARLGGDEFAILHMSAEGPQCSAVLAARIVERLRKPFSLTSGTVQIGVSIGIACAPIDGIEADQLLRNADLALYRAKSDGRNRFHFFDTTLDASARRRNQIEHELRLALTNDTLTLNFQPLVSADSGKVVCAEALLRWHHTTLGPISPAEFIPIAEETGLITGIGAWVMNQACKLAADWPEHVRVAVNLSPRQFLSPGLLPMIENALSQNAMIPARLELEMTESLLMDATPGIEGTLKALRNLGLRIALDDFGTGFSSLSYLRHYRFDKLKIDQSFISDLESNADSRAIVSSVIDLAKQLRMSVAAEGIESAGQFEMLKQLGCTEIQGYLVGRPMPIEMFEAYLAAGNGEQIRLSA
ncbi:EAL domain-containing protein [Rhizobium sp. 18065]|uniref:putative bifunctional diguanylate cyclase/phosphodiesterase n=1 Tax=Rhizobium sp. 18065 TaxID=2681411 RepID=UPI001359EB1A|nr:EAL domain-containing protein [Rhizobium sp. 18065]